MSSIVQQVEFYFSNENILSDKFMNENLRKNGGLLLLTLMTFKRMSKYSLEEVEKAIKEESKELKLEEGVVKRLAALPDVEERQKIRDELNLRSAVLQNVPTNWDLDFMQKHLGPLNVNSIRIRRNGLVFISFASLEDFEKFMKDDLVVEEKTIEKQSLQEWKKTNDDKPQNEKRGKGLKRGFKGRRNDRDSRKEAEGEAKVESKSEPKAESKDESKPETKQE